MNERTKVTFAWMLAERKVEECWLNAPIKPILFKVS
uniref:Uncharacterized protein n=1 Tax=Cucumis melo TaxID=3656 RepID=A0A9I9E565_CUCME